MKIESLAHGRIDTEGTLRRDAQKGCINLVDLEWVVKAMLNCHIELSGEVRASGYHVKG